MQAGARRSRAEASSSRELGRNRTREANEEPAQALKNAGVDPSEVEILIATHLHWDHCGNISLFANAEIYVQRRELEFAAAPLDIYLGVYDSAIINMNPKWSGSVSRFRLVDGDFNLASGVRLLSLPGRESSTRVLT